MKYILLILLRLGAWRTDALYGKVTPALRWFGVTDITGGTCSRLERWIHFKDGTKFDVDLPRIV